MYFVDYLPITTDNRLRLYVDGSDYCKELDADLRQAKKFVFLTGLHFMADFQLVRRGASADVESRLVQELEATAKRGVEVFLLVNQFWKDESEITAGQVFAPVRNKIMTSGELHGYLPETFRLFHLLRHLKNVHCRTDIHTNSDTFGTNHQKTVVIDDRVAFLGGIDLTFLDGDRWDTHEHKTKYRAVDRTQKFWHDVHLRVEGPAVPFVRDNFVQRWQYGNLHEVTDKTVFPAVNIPTQGGQIEIPEREIINARQDKRRVRLPNFPRSKVEYRYPDGSESPTGQTVQIVRSMPRKDNWDDEKPIWNKSREQWERSCKDAYLLGIKAAKKYIYLENQWIADEDIWKELAAAAVRNRDNEDFRIVLMVPYEGLFAAGLGSNQELFIGTEMNKVVDGSSHETTFGVYSLMQSAKASGGSSAAQIYVHSKILIVDDEWSLIGSANAGGISLEGIRGGRDEPDTELSAIILDTEFSSAFRKRLWEEHLGEGVSAHYEAKDADRFRAQAEASPLYKVRFFPGYDNARRGRPTWWFRVPAPSRLPVEEFRKRSSISPSFSERLRWNLPPVLIRASFKATVVPDAPDGYRCWYRWKCELFSDPPYSSKPRRTPINFQMRSLETDEANVWQYSDQAAVYIGTKTAEAIDRLVRDVEPGRVVCRVQFVPVDERPDPDTMRWPSIALVYECLFMNSRFATHNLDPNLLP